MIALVLADLRGRWRSLAGMGAGCFVLLIVLCGTYSAIGGTTGLAKSFGTGHTPQLFSAISGSSSIDIFSPAPYLAFGFGHPLFLVLNLSVAISSGIAAIATDIETGRSELLFTAPIRRTAIFDARLIGWLIAQTSVVVCAIAGALIGMQLSADLSTVSWEVPFRVAAQFSSLVFFLAGVAFAASARSRSRGAALGIAIGVAAGSYVLNLVALLWSPLSFLRHVNPFGYYSPTESTTHIAWGNAGVLFLGGVILLAFARRWLSTRDLA